MACMSGSAAQLAEPASPSADARCMKGLRATTVRKLSSRRCSASSRRLQAATRMLVAKTVAMEEPQALPPQKQLAPPCCSALLGYSCTTQVHLPWRWNKALFGIRVKAINPP